MAIMPKKLSDNNAMVTFAEKAFKILKTDPDEPI